MRDGNLHFAVDIALVIRVIPENLPIYMSKNINKPDYQTSENKNFLEDFLLYPNPASSNIWVEFYSNTNTIIAITDITEQIIQEVPVHETGKVQCSINVEHLKKGIYFVSVKGEKAYYKPKVMVKL